MEVAQGESERVWGLRRVESEALTQIARAGGKWRRALWIAVAPLAWCGMLCAPAVLLVPMHVAWQSRASQGVLIAIGAATTLVMLWFVCAAIMRVRARWRAGVVWLDGVLMLVGMGAWICVAPWVFTRTP
ncbi:MAG TPA: hypothetical protein VK157_15425 [Phycisphaerales bacterium]|nr:hypothetical protein [Phycisphaerales bacterium]